MTGVRSDGAEFNKRIFGAAAVDNTPAERFTARVDTQNSHFTTFPGAE
jgi:hypothetical protein